AEVLRDGTVGREEALSVARGLEPLHPLLPRAGGLVRILRAVLEIAVRAMFYARQNFAFGRFVALEFVGDEHAWDVGQALKEFAEKFLRRPLTPPAFPQDIRDFPVLIARPPQIVMLALDSQKHLLQVPLVTRPGTAVPQLVSVLLAKFTAPL